MQDISGQKVIEQTYDKIRKLVKIREEKGLDFLIEADGSMNEMSIVHYTKQEQIW